MDHRLGLTLISPDDDPGHKVLALTERGKPSVNTSTEESMGLVIARLGIETVSVIGGAVAAHFTGRGAASKGLSKIASRILGGIVFFAIQAVGKAVTHVPDIIANIERGSLRNLPDFSSFLNLSLEHVRWPNATDYELTSAAFRDGLQIGVRLVDTNAVSSTSRGRP
jgi:hypothetical protein